MLIEFNNITKYNIIPRGVIHVGMHTGEEYSIYKSENVKNIIFIEANEQLFLDGVEKFKNDKLVSCRHAAISNIKEPIIFTITNNGESSSILSLADHAMIYPSIIPIKSVDMITSTLDDVLMTDEKSLYNVINLDIQGAELKAMQGFKDWEFIDAVFTEINYREMYKGCALLEDIVTFLMPLGFVMVEEVNTGAGWGDALFIKQHGN